MLPFEKTVKRKNILDGNQAAIMGMGADRIVEAGDIGNETLFELLDGLIAAIVQLFLLEILEKALHNSVIVGVTLGGKGLDHPQLVNDLAKICRSELGALVSVEHHAVTDTPEPHRIS
jgi:hypothetical protein